MPLLVAVPSQHSQDAPVRASWREPSAGT